MSFASNASTNWTETMGQSEPASVCSDVRTTHQMPMVGANGTPLHTPNGPTPTQTTSGIPLGASPRPKRPAPMVLTNTQVTTIEEEPIEEKPSAKKPAFPPCRATREMLTPLPHSKTAPIISAIREIVKIRSFGDPILTEPAPLIPGVLYLGDASQAMDTDTLRELGITAILNCASGACLTNAAYYGEDFAYHEFDAEDSSDYQMAPHAVAAHEFFVRCVEEGRPVFVHCAAGINRSAFIAIYLYMAATHTPLVEAVRHCFALRPIILCNEGFIHQLVEVAVRERRV